MRRYCHRQNYSLISIYHSSSSICILQLKRDGAVYRIQDVRLHVAPQSSMSSDNVSTTLQALLSKMKVKRKYAAIAIDDELAITKIIEVKTTLKDVYKEAEICLQAQHLIPYPLSELYYDFTVIDSKSSKQALTKVLFVAVRRDYINKQIEMIQKAGLKLRHIDLQSFSILRTCHLLGKQHFNDALEKTIVLIEFLDKKLTIKIINNFTLIFTSESMFGEASFISDNEDDNYLMNRDNISNQVKDNSPIKQEILIKRIVKLIDLEIERYHLTQMYYKPDLFIMTGNPSLLSDKLVQSIQQKFTIPCYLSNPFMKINFSELIEIQHLNVYAHHLIMCCGLALASWLGGSNCKSFR